MLQTLPTAVLAASIYGNTPALFPDLPRPLAPMAAHKSPVAQGNRLGFLGRILAILAVLPVFVLGLSQRQTRRHIYESVRLHCGRDSCGP